MVPVVRPKPLRDILGDDEVPPHVRDAVVETMTFIDSLLQPLLKRSDNSAYLAVILLVVGIAERIKGWPEDLRRELIRVFAGGIGAEVINVKESGGGLSPSLRRTTRKPRRLGRNYR